MNAWIGGLNNIFLLEVGRGSLRGTLPESVFVMFQMTFAIITPALIIGGFAERMKFSAMLLFSIIWVTVVYFPVCHVGLGWRLVGKRRPAGFCRGYGSSYYCRGGGDCHGNGNWSS